MSTWDDKPNDYEHAVNEIQRLQLERNQFHAALRWQRTAIIEQCAQLVETHYGIGCPDAGPIAAAIRALKDKYLGR